MQTTNVNTNNKNESGHPVLPKQNPHYSVMIERIVKIVLIVTAILAVV